MQPAHELSCFVYRRLFLSLRAITSLSVRRDCVLLYAYCNILSIFYNIQYIATRDAHSVFVAIVIQIRVTSIYYIRGKNDFVEGSKILLNTNLKISLLDYQNIFETK